MDKSNGEFGIHRHRIEGVIGALLMAAWVMGSVILVGLQNTLTA